MKTNDEIRRENLKLAIRRVGTAAKLAELSGTVPAYLSQIKNSTPDSKSGTRKMMGDDIARRIELALNEVVGWMDQDHSQTVEAKEQAAPPHGPHTQWIGDDEAALLDAYRTTDDDGRLMFKQIMRSVRKFPLQLIVADKK